MQDFTLPKIKLKSDVCYAVKEKSLGNSYEIWQDK